MNAETLGLISLLLTAACLVGWFRGMQSVTLEGKRGLFIAGFGLAFGLAVAALAQGVGLVVGGLSVFSLLASGVFLGLSAISGQEQKEPAVAVGGPMLEFRAPSDDGTLFESSALRGRPFLLKFFRGHW